MSFHRAAHRPRGPPDGGNGGRGADVWIRAEAGVKQLPTYTRVIRAPCGGAGQRARKRGADGTTHIIRVPRA